MFIFAQFLDFCNSWLVKRNLKTCTKYMQVCMYISCKFDLQSKPLGEKCNALVQASSYPKLCFGMRLPNFSFPRFPKL